MLANIQSISGSLLGKGKGTAKFINVGPDAMQIDDVIEMTFAIDNTASGIGTPTCSKGTFTKIDASYYRLTLTEQIAKDEEFDIDFTVSIALKKATTVTVDIVKATNQTDFTDDTATATYTPQPAIVEVVQNLFDKKNETKPTVGYLVFFFVISILVGLGLRKYLNRE